MEEGSSVALDVGVEAREGLDFAADEEDCRPAGVAALRLGFSSSDDEDLLLTVVQDSTLGNGDELSLKEAADISQLFSSCMNKDFYYISSEQKSHNATDNECK